MPHRSGGVSRGRAPAARSLVLRRLLCAAALTLSISTGCADSCAAASGGQPGARAQLRFVDVSDERVIFIFGLAAGGGFGLPTYAVEPREGASFIVRFDGASTINEDGSASYDGSGEIRGDGLVRKVRLVNDSGASMRWELELAARTCPRVIGRAYAAGTTFPRAQVALLLRGDSAITIESSTRYAGGPITLSGLGFAPSKAVTITIAGHEAHRTMSDADGAINTSFFIPELSAGTYALVAADASGHQARVSLEVTVRP